MFFEKVPSAPHEDNARFVARDVTEETALHLSAVARQHLAYCARDGELPSEDLLRFVEGKSLTLDGIMSAVSAMNSTALRPVEGRTDWARANEAALEEIGLGVEGMLVQPRVTRPIYETDAGAA